MERLLSPIADVHRGETGGVLLMALTLLLLMAAYYMLKTARESLILTRGGAEVKTYASAAQALILLFVVPGFAALASRVNRMRLMRWVTLFFVGNLTLFTVLGPASPTVVLLVICVVLASFVHTWEVRHQDPHRSAKASAPIGKEGAFELIRRDRYLLLITLYVVIFNVLDTSGLPVRPPARQRVDRALRRHGRIRRGP
jgi:ATP/ADP translocase